MSTLRLLSSVLASAALVAVPLASPASAHHDEDKASFAQLSMAFEPNLGQADSDIDFVARGRGYTVSLRGGEASLALIDGATLDIDLIGSDAQPGISTQNELPGKVNYLRGTDPSQWQTDVATFGRVTYSQVYPGIDVAYYGQQGALEYDFIVNPGAQPDAIRIQLQGADSLELDQQGDLVVHTSSGDLRQPKPFIYQADGRAVDGGFVLDGQQLSFEVQAYDHSQSLIIDPALEYSTYLGGKGDENYWFGVFSAGIAVDAAGSAYVVGSTTSPDFPKASNTFKDGGMDVFVAKLNPSGSALVYSTYLGGIGFDMGNAIAVDRMGNAYVTGLTNSPDFPLFNALQPVYGGGSEDAFVAKLNPTGSGLVFSTYLGGNGAGWGEMASGIAVDGAMNVYVTGVTNSPNFPLVNPAQPALGGLVDAFLTRLTPSGTGIVYSTLMGGLGEDAGQAVAVDRNGNAYITGRTLSDGLAAPANVLQPLRNGAPNDAFVAKYAPAGNRVYMTYLGGGGDELGYGIAVDNAGNTYVAGRTGGTFYITPGWFDQTCFDPAAFVAKLNATATGLVYAGCLDAPGKDGAFGLALDRAENLYVAGFTLSPKFPVVDAFQPVLRGTSDAFISKINASGTVLVYSSFLGGTGTEMALGVAVDNGGHAYVTGWTASPTDFPTKAPLQPLFGGGSYDAFVVKIDCGP